MSAHEVYPNIFVGDLTAAHFWPGPKLAIREQPSEYIYHSMDDKQIMFRYGHVTKEILKESSEWLNRMKNKGIPILVHCSGGLHRSALVVAYWISKREHITINDAYNRMRKYRTEIEPRPDWVEEME